MQFRDHPAVDGKRDFYPIDPRHIKVEPGFNIRDLEAAHNREHIEALKDSIRVNGVRNPVQVRLDGDDIFLVDGHCRHAAVLELIAEGIEFKTIPAIPEAKYTSPEERVLNVLIAGTGKRPEPLEVAKGIKRLFDLGWSEAKIQERMGWKSRNSVTDHLKMAAMPEAVKEHVRQGDVSASLAAKIVKESDQAETAADRIRKNKEENAKILGSTRTRVTPKTLKRDAEKKKAEQRKLSPDIQVSGGTAAAATDLPAEQQPAADIELSQPPAPTLAEAKHAMETTLRAADERWQQERELETDDLHQATLAKVEEHNGWRPDQDDGLTAPTINKGGRNEWPSQVTERPGPPAPSNPPEHAIKLLIDALEPFAAAVELNDLGERPDDDVIEIPIRDLKRAWRAYTQATGGTS